MSGGDHGLFLVGHVFTDDDEIGDIVAEQAIEELTDEALPEGDHIAGELGIVEEKHAEAFEAEPFAELPEGAVDVDAGGGGAVFEPAGAVEVIGREAAGVVDEVAGLHLLPVGTVFDRAFEPGTGDEVDGVAEVGDVELVGDFADVAFPVLDDKRPGGGGAGGSGAAFEDFFFELGDHAESRGRYRGSRRWAVVRCPGVDGRGRGRW